MISRKLSDKAIRAIRADPRKLETIARQYGRSKALISLIKLRERYTHVEGPSSVPANSDRYLKTMTSSCENPECHNTVRKIRRADGSYRDRYCSIQCYVVHGARDVAANQSEQMSERWADPTFRTTLIQKFSDIRRAKYRENPAKLIEQVELMRVRRPDVRDRFTDKQVRDIRADVRRLYEIAKDYGVKGRTIKAIKYRESYGYVDGAESILPSKTFSDQEIRNIRADGRSQRVIAEDNDVSETTIYQIKHGRLYKQVPASFTIINKHGKIRRPGRAVNTPEGHFESLTSAGKHHGITKHGVLYKIKARKAGWSYV